MAETAAHLVDYVFPMVPVRQWVLSIPFALRYRLAYDSSLLSDILNIFIRVVFGQLRRGARDLLEFERSDFIAKLAALVPAPRAHLRTYHGILAPAAKWRPLIVPTPDVHFGACAHVPVAPESTRRTESEPDRTASAPTPRRKNYSWSE